MTSLAATIGFGLFAVAAFGSRRPIVGIVCMACAVITAVGL